MTQPVFGRTAFRRNTIHGVEVGIMQSTGLSEGNTIYDSYVAGAWIGNTTNFRENRIYSSLQGIEVRDMFGNGTADDNPTISSNLLYGNASGIQVNAGTSAQILGTRSTQMTGHPSPRSPVFGAVRIENNILSVDTGTAIAFGRSVRYRAERLQPVPIARHW